MLTNVQVLKRTNVIPTPCVPTLKVTMSVAVYVGMLETEETVQVYHIKKEFIVPGQDFPFNLRYPKTFMISSHGHGVFENSRNLKKRNQCLSDCFQNAQECDRNFL